MKTPLTASQIEIELKPHIKRIWDMLKPLQRTRVFHLKPTNLFVFHTWSELNKQQRELVYNGVRIAIENAIVRQETQAFIHELNRIGKKYLPIFKEAA